uniref:Uncharacterized protein n=1 Tax=Eptatretus burgeri TaxID=7764 RepID=A0A8C4R1E8_EPTBU
MSTSVSTGRGALHQRHKDLTCPVCFGIFEDPRVLPCSHTFCCGCLEKLIQASLAEFPLWRPLRLPFRCPTCRHATHLPPAPPPTATATLPVNFALLAIIDKFQLGCDGTATGDLACTEHPSEPLNLWCERDRHLVCAQCVTVGVHLRHNVKAPQVQAKEALAQDAQRVEEFFQVRSEANTAAIAEPTDLAEASHVANTQANDSHLKQILQIKVITPNHCEFSLDPRQTNLNHNK